MIMSCEYKQEGDITWRIARHPNGKIHIKTPFVNGERNGLGVSFTKNGNVSRQFSHMNNVVHGVETRFYPGSFLASLIKSKRGERKLFVRFQSKKVRNPQAIKINLRKKKAYITQLSL